MLLTHLAGVHHLDREALRMRLLSRAQSHANILIGMEENLAGSDGSRSDDE